jgi:hypothetical protein
MGGQQGHPGRRCEWEETRDSMKSAGIVRTPGPTAGTRRELEDTCVTREGAENGRTPWLSGKVQKTGAHQRHPSTRCGREGTKPTLEGAGNLKTPTARKAAATGALQVDQKKHWQLENTIPAIADTRKKDTITTRPNWKTLVMVVHFKNHISRMPGTFHEYAASRG